MDETLTPLHLLHTRPDPRRLAAWAARRRLLEAGGDPGYALHALLHAVFGAQAPQPFRHLDGDQGLLAYTGMDPDTVRRLVALAEPDVVAALGLAATAEHGGFSLRPFPSRWPRGHVLGFESRIRPVIREGRTGRERDAFLAEIERAGPGTVVDRADVYRRWLQTRLQDRLDAGTAPWQGAAELVHAEVTRHRLLGVLRRTQPSGTGGAGPARQARVAVGPDVVLQGRLRVLDPDAFGHLLARGIGRHRAFGFGMLLLRPAD